MSDSLWSDGLQHARLPCPSPSPGVCSNSCPLNQWCHPTISSCHPLLFHPSILSTIRVFSNEIVVHIQWPKYWSKISLKNMYMLAIFTGPCPIDSLKHCNQTSSKPQKNVSCQDQQWPPSGGCLRQLPTTPYFYPFLNFCLKLWLLLVNLCQSSLQTFKYPKCPSVVRFSALPYSLLNVQFLRVPYFKISLQYLFVEWMENKKL